MNVPEDLIYPSQVFAAKFKQRAEEGIERLQHSKVAFVGLARNCADKLAINLARLEHLVPRCREWALHIESNDCQDATLEVLHGFTSDHPQATFHYSVLGRRQYGAEFAGPRTIAMAEYRDACQRWVRACHPDADYVVVVDFDQWGGWSEIGVFTGIGWLIELQAAYAMASVSLMQHPVTVSDNKGTRDANAWLHYDCWALRGVGQHDNYWDDYSIGYGGWKHHWVPPVGSPPVLVASAFGGLCIYRTAAYLAGTYDGTSDCEHIAMHRSIAKATGQLMYLNPSQRCVMHWLEDTHARQHGDH